MHAAPCASCVSGYVAVARPGGLCQAVTVARRPQRPARRGQGLAERANAPTRLSGQSCNGSSANKYIARIRLLLPCWEAEAQIYYIEHCCMNG